MPSGHALGPAGAADAEANALVVGAGGSLADGDDAGGAVALATGSDWPGAGLALQATSRSARSMRTPQV